MAKLPEKIKVDVIGMDKVQTMIDLLDKYKDDLPEELMNSFNHLADCEACEYNTEKLQSMFIKARSVECLIDGVKVNGVVSANIILKRLTVYPNSWDGKETAQSINNSFVEGYKYPDNFTMNDIGGNKILGWG